MKKKKRDEIIKQIDHLLDTKNNLDRKTRMELTKYKLMLERLLTGVISNVEFYETFEAIIEYVGRVKKRVR